jgi:hypothetical protein
MTRPSLIAGLPGGPIPLRGLRGRLLSPLVTPALRSLASLFWILVLTAGLAAQSPPAGEVVLQAYTLRHQRAGEAVALVGPLLSPKGTVELQPQGNTLVIRDTAAALGRIMPVLKRFDHPPRPMRLEVLIVRASRAVVSPQVQRSDLPEQLTRRLRHLLAYDVFETQAQAQLAGVEGQPVVYDLGQEYKVSFRFGTLSEDQRVKLSSFRISRQGEGRQPVNMLQTNVMLWIDQTMSLGLAKSESSPEALMVVLTLRGGEVARRQP